MNAVGRLTGSPAADEGDADRAQLWTEFGTSRSANVRERLFVVYLPFAKRIARRRYHGGRTADIELQDLVQLASTGLLEAIDRFDPDQGTVFEAFASRRINGAVLDGLSRMSELRQQVSHRHRLKAERTRSLVSADADKLPDDEAMRAFIDAAVGLAIGFILEGSGPGQGDGPVDMAPNGYESLAWRETVTSVVRAMSHLPEREQAVIRYHYFEGMIFDQIGALMSITKGRVSQLHKSAIQRLRGRLDRGDDFRLQR
jgi:RNA polymerase sigma factor FliA